MLIELNRGGELWWVRKKPPHGRNTYLRYGVKQDSVSYAVTLGYIVKLEDGDCVPCTDDGVALLYKAKWGPLSGDISYMETMEQAIDIVLHMSRDYAGYLRRPTDGRTWQHCMHPLLTCDYIWELAQC